MNELTIVAKTENLGEVLEFVEQGTVTLPPKERNKVNIAVEEIFVNIASYAYAPEVGDVAVRVTTNNSENVCTVTVEFEDSGAEFDPLAREEPDITADVDDRNIGGLGIFMTRQIMDDVHYRRDGDRNILTITKSVR